MIVSMARESNADLFFSNFAATDRQLTDFIIKGTTNDFWLKEPLVVFVCHWIGFMSYLVYICIDFKESFTYLLLHDEIDYCSPVLIEL